MAVNLVQSNDILFKKWLGLGTTQSGRQFFSEPITGRPFVTTSQIWSQSSLIPATAPGATAGVVQVMTNYPLVRVVGTVNAYSGSLLRDAIPFNWDSAGSYNYNIKDDVGNNIPFGSGDWTVDTEAGILMFNTTGASNLPVNPTISFWRYSGTKGVGTSNPAGVTGLAVSGNSPLTGFVQMVGTSGIQLIQSSNPNIIEVRLAAGANSYMFNSGLSSGVQEQWIAFPTGLGTNPTVIASLTSNQNDTIIPFLVSGETSSGFWAAFGASIPDNSYELNVLAATTRLTGLVTSVTSNTYNITNNYANAGVGALVVTGQTLSGNVGLTGVGGIQVTVSGTNVVISGGNTINTGQFITQGYNAPIDWYNGTTHFDSGRVIISGGSILYVQKVLPPTATNLVLGTPPHTAADELSYNIYISGGSLNYNGSPTRAGSVYISAGAGIGANDLAGRIVIGGHLNGDGSVGEISLDGFAIFTRRPTVDGTGFILSGDLQTGQFITTAQTGRFAEYSMVVWTTGNQYVQGQKIFSGSFVQGYNSAAPGSYAHAEGFGNGAWNLASHAEGQSTTAWNIASHTEGENTQTFGEASHAEGRYSIASGDVSHAEGYQTTAYGFASHSEGNFTIATGDYQTVMGQFNVSDPVPLVIIGGGTSAGNRQNIVTFDRTGINVSGTGNFLAVFVRGNAVITTNQTGQFAPSGMTGQFITTAQTGQFVTTAQTGHVHSQYALSAGTGQFISTAQTGQFAPSGMTGQFITTAITGNAFYPRYGNPEGYLTNATLPSAGGVNYLIVTGNLVSGNVTFSGAGNVAVVTGASGTNQIIFSGVTGNLVFQGHTGQFAPSGMTGQFVTTAQTGHIHSQYALVAGTGQFISTAQTGQFAPSGMTGQFVTSNQIVGFAQYSQVVLLTGDQTIDGYKTFNSPVVANNVSGINANAGRINLSNLTLRDGNDKSAVNWSIRVLRSSGVQQDTLDWEHLALTGTWDAQGLTISGIPVLTGGLSSFVTTGQTGQFITTAQTGQFAPSGMTGQFVTTAMTGGYVNAFPRRTETGQFAPSGMTGQFITTAVTGNAFYPRYGNPEGYLTNATLPSAGGVNYLIVTGNMVSGNVTLTGAGNVALATGAAGTNQIVISGVTGNLVFQGHTGQFAPAGMTGQFITTAQTGQFAPSGMTGQFVTTAQTGHIHSQYALVAGTGQFISTAQTGQFAPSGMTGQFVTTNKTGQFITTAQTGQFATYSNVVWLTGDQSISGTKTFVIPVFVSGRVVTPIISPYLDSGVNSYPMIEVASGKLWIYNGSTAYAPTLSWEQCYLTTRGNVTVANWNIQTLYDTTTQISLDWQNRQLADSAGIGSLDWQNRWLVNSSIATTLDWNTKTLTGTWDAGGLTVNGQPVLFGDTGQFVTSTQTGLLVNAFPRRTETGQFAPSGMTGQFITTANTGQYVNAFPRRTETGQFAPSGMTGQFVTTAQTGHVHSQYALVAGTGQFISTAQTGIFLTNAQISGVVYVTGNQTITGFKYFLSDLYLNSHDPSGYKRLVFVSGTGANMVEKGALQYISNEFVTTGRRDSVELWSNKALGLYADGMNVVWARSTGLSFYAPVTFESGNASVYVGRNPACMIETSHIGRPNILTINFDDGNVDVGSSTRTVAHFIDCTLGTQGGAETLNWSGRQLSGTWSAGGLLISGNPVLTGSIGDTGQFVTTAKTGQFLTNNYASPVTLANTLTVPVVLNNQSRLHLQSGIIYTNVTTAPIFSWTDAYQLLSGTAWGWTTAGILGVNTINAYGISGPPNIDVANKRLIGSNSRYSIDYGNYKLYTGVLEDKVVLDWSSHEMSGNWIAQSLILSGSPVIIALQTGQFAPSGMTGQFITTAQTGIFYPASNPNNYITAAQAGGVSAVSVTGASVSGNVNFTGLRGINVSLSGQYVLISGGDTGQFITTAQTGQFAPSGMTGQFVTTAMTGSYVNAFPRRTETGQFAPSGMTGQFITTAQTGHIHSQYALASMTGEFLVHQDTGVLVPRGETGQFYPFYGNPLSFVSGIRLTRTLPTDPSSGCANVGTFSMVNGAHDFMVDAVVSDAGFSVSKRYFLNISYAQVPFTYWSEVVPSYSSGPYGGQDFALDISGNAGFDVTLRLRRSAGTNAGTVNLNIINLGSATDAFTPSSTTGMGPMALAQYSSDSKTGLYYPRVGNPSGFVLPWQTGQYVTTAKTGQFLTTNYSGTTRFGGGMTVDGNITLVGPSAFLYPVGIADYSNTYSINMSDGTLRDNDPSTALSWATRTLKDLSSNTTLDWNNRIITGSWSAQAFLISGSSPVLSTQTGQFVDSSKTGQFLTTNYSGYGIKFVAPVTIANNLTVQSGFIAATRVSSTIVGGAPYDGIDITAKTLSLAGAGSTITRLNWSSCILATGVFGGFTTLDWSNLWLGESGAQTLNWKTRTMTGKWDIQGLTVAGQPLLAGNTGTLSSYTNTVWTTGNQFGIRGQKSFADVLHGVSGISLGLQTDTGRIRGLLDIKYSIQLASPVSITFNPYSDAGGNMNDGNFYTIGFKVYAYANTSYGRVYSLNPAINSYVEDGTYGQYFLDVSWDAVANADGYLVLVDDMGYIGQTYDDLWIDVGNVTAITPYAYGSINYLNTPARPATLAQDTYINASGHLLHGNNIVLTHITGANVTASGTSLVLRQLGDLGESSLTLLNRNSYNGAVFEAMPYGGGGGQWLVDFIMKGGSVTRNIRMEGRAGQGRAGSPAWHIGGSSIDSPTLAIGDTYADVKKLYVGNINVVPSALLHIAAGTSALSGAPLKFTAGTLTTIPEAGAIEYTNGSGFFITHGTNRQAISTGAVGGGGVTSLNVSGQSMAGSITVTGIGGNFIQFSGTTLVVSGSPVSFPTGQLLTTNYSGAEVYFGNPITVGHSLALKGVGNNPAYILAPRNFAGDFNKSLIISGGEGNKVTFALPWDAGLVHFAKTSPTGAGVNFARIFQFTNFGDTLEYFMMALDTNANPMFMMPNSKSFRFTDAQTSPADVLKIDTNPFRVISSGTLNVQTILMSGTTVVLATQTGTLAPAGMTGQFVTTNKTGQFLSTNYSGSTRFGGATFLNADANGTVPLTISGANTQWQDLTVWRNAAAAKLASINASGTMINVNSNYANVAMGGVPGSEASYAGMWLAQASPGFSNYLLLGGNNQAFINAPSFDIEFRVANSTKATVGPNGLMVLGTANVAPIFPFSVSGTVGQGHQLFMVTTSGKVGINLSGQPAVPSAQVHISGGQTSPSSAPIKINPGSVMTNPEVGAIESDGSNLYFTNVSNVRGYILTGQLPWTGGLGGSASAGVNSIIYSGGSSFNSNVRITGMNGVIVSGNAGENMLYVNPNGRGPVNLGTGNMVGWWYGSVTSPRRHVMINWNSGENFQYICSGTGYGAEPQNVGKLLFVHTGVVNGKTIRCSFTNTGCTFPATNGDPIFSGEPAIYSGVHWPDEFAVGTPQFPGWVGLNWSTTSEAHTDVYEFTCIGKMVFGTRKSANAYIPNVIAL